MRVVRDGLLFCPCCTLMACNGDTCDCGDDPRNHPVAAAELAERATLAGPSNADAVLAHYLGGELLS